MRARYYVFSGVEPSRDVFNALLEAKRTWENKEQGWFFSIHLAKAPICFTLSSGQWGHIESYWSWIYSKASLPRRCSKSHSKQLAPIFSHHSHHWHHCHHWHHWQAASTIFAKLSNPETKQPPSSPPVLKWNTHLQRKVITKIYNEREKKKWGYYLCHCNISNTLATIPFLISPPRLRILKRKHILMELLHMSEGKCKCQLWSREEKPGQISHSWGQQSPSVTFFWPWRNPFWEFKNLTIERSEVTIIPTYDTDVLGYWVAENEELLTELKIDLAPSASRCTINLQVMIAKIMKKTETKTETKTTTNTNELPNGLFHHLLLNQRAKQCL